MKEIPKPDPDPSSEESEFDLDCPDTLAKVISAGFSESTLKKLNIDRKYMLKVASYYIRTHLLSQAVKPAKGKPGIFLSDRFRAEYDEPVASKGTFAA